MHTDARAAILTKLGHDLEVDYINVPAPGHGQVAVKVAFSGVCHSQLMEVRGKRGNDPYLPHLLGHEGSGVVIATGNGVTKVKVGDKVILGWIKSSGLDVPGVRFYRGSAVVNAGAVTTFSTHTIVSENRCVKLPDGVPMDAAVLFGCALLTGAGMVFNQIMPEAGSTVALFGLGGVGLSALLALKMFDCSRIIAIDVETSKLGLAKECGATDVINAAVSPVGEEISRLTNGVGVDYAIEATGQARSIEVSFEMVRKGGGLSVFASHPPNGEKIALNPHDFICGKRIEGSWGGASKPDTDIPKLAELFRSGKIPLDKIIGSKYSLNQINQALNDLENRKITRALIDMEI